MYTIVLRVMWVLLKQLPISGVLLRVVFLCTWLFEWAEFPLLHVPWSYSCHWPVPARLERSIIYLITRYVTVVMQLANPRHPRPAHITRYWPLGRSNITRYGLDFDPRVLQTKKNAKSAGSLAVRVINVLLTAHAGNTVLGTCPHGCTVRACIGRYRPGAWSITHTYCLLSWLILRDIPQYLTFELDHGRNCTCKMTFS